MDSHKKMTLNLHDILIKESSSVQVDEAVCVCLSGGIDSVAVLLSLMEVGRQVRAYSFTLEDRESTDFKRAREVCKKLNVDFVPIYLPVDVDLLQQDVLKLVKLGCRLKTDFECVWPFMYVFQNAKENVIATGIPADGHFCISKKGMINYKDDVDGFRTMYFGNPNAGQRLIREELARIYHKSLFDPFYSTSIFNYLSGSSWDELNKPRQKMPIYNAFKEFFDQEKISKHTNLQLGDSGISKHFEKLLITDWNKRNHKSVVGIYNQIVNNYEESQIQLPMEF